MGQIIQAEIIPDHTTPVDVEELIGYCRKKLSTYKVPQRVAFVDQLPMTASGKLIRY